MKRYYLILLSAIVAISSVACSSRQQKSVADAPADSAENSSVKVPTERVFMPALAPAMLPQRDKVLYMNEHYWDKFDFADTLFIKDDEECQYWCGFDHSTVCLQLWRYMLRVICPIRSRGVLCRDFCLKHRLRRQCSITS